MRHTVQTTLFVLLIFALTSRMRMRMEMQTATLRDLKNFPAIRRKVDRHGEVVIMHKGKPFYVITRLARRKIKRKRVPKIDYWARLVARQSKPLTAEQSQALHDHNRGDR
jgi:hypothetical protein